MRQYHWSYGYITDGDLLPWQGYGMIYKNIYFQHESQLNGEENAGRESYKYLTTFDGRS